MKKLSILILMVFGYFSNAVAIEGLNLGASLLYGGFEVDGGKEEFKGQHVGVLSPGDVSKSTAGQDEAEGAFALGSIFAEYEVNDVIAFGIDYVPHSMETETAENTLNETGSDVKNTVQVDFEDLTTAYVLISPPDAMGLYLKAGMMQVDVITNEKLATGGKYGNTDLDGSMFGVGYVYAADNGAFVRIEGNYLSFDSQEITNTKNSDVKVKLKNLDGLAGKISIGKSF